MKNEVFQMRISTQAKADLNELARYYDLTASATVVMLIARETRLMQNQKEQNKK